MSGYNPTLKEAKAAFQEMLEAHVAEGAKDQEHDYNLQIVGDFLNRMEAFESELNIKLRNNVNFLNSSACEDKALQRGRVEAITEIVELFNIVRAY